MSAGLRLAGIFITTLAACGPGARLEPGENSTSKIMAPPLVQALDELDILENMVGKPFVRVVDGGAADDSFAILIEDDADHFTLFDGIDERVYEKLHDRTQYADAAPPPRVERVDERQVARALSVRRGERALLALIVASTLHKRGYESEAQSLLTNLAPNPKELRALVRETVATRLINDAVQRYANGALQAEYEHSLVRAAALTGTKPSAIAVVLLKELHAPKGARPAPRTALDGLVERRIDALADERCLDERTGLWNGWGDRHFPPAVAALVSLGFTARAALERTKEDRHPSRCMGADVSAGGAACDLDASACPLVNRLATVGELARRALDAIEAARRSWDASDVECARGNDTEAIGLVQNALATKDIPQAVALAKAAQGMLRMRMVALIAKTADPLVSAFLLDEATSGPVLAARIQATDGLSARGESGWVALAATAIDAALRSDSSDERCDSGLVAGRLPSLLDVAPAEALKPIEVNFASYGLRAKLNVVLDLATRRTPAAGSWAILALALAETRPAAAQMSFVVGPARELRTVSCVDPSPSDIASVFLGQRLHVAYACTDPAADKARAVQKILAMRGKTPSW